MSLIVFPLLFLFALQLFSRHTISFHDFSNTVFKNEVNADTLSLHYTIANPKAYDIALRDPSLPLFSIAGEKEKYARLENYLKILKSYDPLKLNPEDSYTHRLLENNLSRELMGNDFYYFQELFSPAGGV